MALAAFATLILCPLASLAAYQAGVNDSAANRAEEIYALAAAFYSDEKWDEAVRQFSLLRQEYPRHELAENATFYLGEALVQMGQPARAATIFGQFLLDYPDHPGSLRARFRLAECNYLSEDFESARNRFVAFMARHGDDPLAEFGLPYLGELHLRFGEADKSRQAYEQALRRFPDSGLSGQCRLGLAEAWYRSGNLAEARRFARLVAEQDNQPLADDALLFIGKLQAGQGRWTDAKREFQRLASQFPESDLAVEARYWTARADLVAGDWQACWEVMEPLMDQPMDDSLFPQVALDAAIAAIRVDRLDRAEEFIDRLTSEDREASTLELASVLEIDIANRKNDLRRLQRLVTAFEHQYSDSVHLTRCIEPLARMHYDRAEYAEAAARYQRLIELASMRSDQARNLPAWRYLLGLSLIGTGQYELALSHLQAIRDFGNQIRFEAATAFAIATALAGDQRWAESIPQYQVYLRLTPDGEDAVRCHADLTVAFVKCDQLQAATRTIDAVTADHSQELSVLGACEVVAEAALSQGQSETAQRFFRILARSNHRQFAARGTHGLVWSGDAETLEPDKLRQVISSGLDPDLVVQAVIGQVQEMQVNGQHDRSIELLRTLLEEHPDSPHADEARVRLAISLQRSGGRQIGGEAAALLEQFLDRQPDHELADLARYELAWARHDQGDIAGAERQFAGIVDDYPESEYRVDACYRAAMLSRDLGDESRCRLRLQQLIHWAPDNRLAAYAHYTLGELASRQEDWDTAMREFETVVETAVDASLIQPARYQLAEALYQSGNLQRAEEAFVGLQEIRFEDPGINTVIGLRLAQCAARRTDWRQVEKLVAALRQETTDTTTAFQLDYLQGRVCMSRAEFNEARQMFARVLASEEASGTQTAAMSQWMTGESWFHQEEYQDALRAYLLVDSLYDFPQWRSLALLQAAKCHLQLGDTETAMKTCRRMLDTFPDSSHASDARELLAEISESAQPPKPRTLPAKFSR
jgi:TolA-binding protein